MDITRSTVFVPGATSGIGLALALRLQARGSTVIVGGRRAALLDEIVAAHPGIDAVRVDTADPESIEAARREVLERHPALDAVVAMAGIMEPEDWTTDDFLATAERTVVTNLLGPIRLAAAFLPHLRTRTGSAFVTVSSGLAHVPLAVTPTYNATKAAVHRLSEGIRLQLEPAGVQVIEIVPPAVRTALMPGQEDSPIAMPLDAFADEVVELLSARPDAHEILVEGVKFLRFAETSGAYDATVARLNATDPHAA
ncbi:SDR family oxidoreductase [Krasilnikoviella flava]|uniref:Short-chain dehydrogenase involved in D-alanine esterification of teichoic acids n=1 Tax=Krasilnikoviella flava TaxID=526729 RepID=A0A1T5LXX0_9MICO|nr:SDR family NAD(P)-dependent oxidoreductase [Krasilnikoviella flava]SKC80836.1 Short-chain dehydrogenase involved in D-alanine esterification of teichoic acids [Krasilnikoviella flava]